MMALCAVAIQHTFLTTRRLIILFALYEMIWFMNNDIDIH